MPSRREVISGGAALAVPGSFGDSQAANVQSTTAEVLAKAETAAHKELARWTKVYLAVERDVKPNMSDDLVREFAGFLKARGDNACLERLRGWFPELELI